MRANSSFAKETRDTASRGPRRPGASPRGRGSRRPPGGACGLTWAGAAGFCSRNLCTPFSQLLGRWKKKHLIRAITGPRPEVAPDAPRQGHPPSSLGGTEGTQTNGPWEAGRTRRLSGSRPSGGRGRGRSSSLKSHPGPRRAIRPRDRRRGPPRSILVAPRKERPPRFPGTRAPTPLGRGPGAELLGCTAGSPALLGSCRAACQGGRPVSRPPWQCVGGGLVTACLVVTAMPGAVRWCLIMVSTAFP